MSSESSSFRLWDVHKVCHRVEKKLSGFSKIHSRKFPDWGFDFSWKLETKYRTVLKLQLTVPRSWKFLAISPVPHHLVPGKTPLNSENGFPDKSPRLFSFSSGAGASLWMFSSRSSALNSLFLSYKAAKPCAFLFEISRFLSTWLHCCISFNMSPKSICKGRFILASFRSRIFPSSSLLKVKVKGKFMCQ